jgi:hypothetical protein
MANPTKPTKEQEEGMNEFESKLPPHKYSLSLTHNQPRDYHETVKEYLDDDINSDRIEWVSEEEKQKAIATNEIWEIQWYPDTPIGFYCVAASTLDALMDGVQDTSVFSK